MFSAIADRTLELAEANKIRSIAFPSIATGAHEYPHDEACDIAASAVARWLTVHVLPRVVIFCCFEEADYDCYRRQLSAMGIAAC
ncbi:MAG TPA: macro domain-containing protein [Pirellulales bacterium]|nr:macro domain-containing protein [Pirellulales bacterium]